MADDRILRSLDREAGIVRLSFNNAARRNTYDPAMRDQLASYLDEAAADDDVKVVHLRGEGGVFSTGADMGNAYAWYGRGAAGGDAQADTRRPSQRRRLRMPADGIVIAKEAFRMVEQLQAYPGEEVFSYITHAFGTNLRFEDGEFNFVKARAAHGRRKRSGCGTSTSTSERRELPAAGYLIHRAPRTPRIPPDATAGSP